ncbi:hypothetical protein BDB01DRAFT_791959 [Pilobolus umbonatus]|nr:hypothetical protein BDB01DRAFT_791959 [Pilobolus umbonatus]
MSFISIPYIPSFHADILSINTQDNFLHIPLHPCHCILSPLISLLVSYYLKIIFL